MDLLQLRYTTFSTRQSQYTSALRARHCSLLVSCVFSATAMSSQTNPRKRAAPGSDLSNDQFLQWGSAGIPQSYDNTSAYVMNNGYPQNAPSSNQLARRPINQAMTRTTNHENVGNQWSDHDQSNTTEGPWLDIQELEAKAQIAKQDAKAKRKQIPPFVQKLNSFLEDGKNTDLIRWSDEGDSFIVLDEDEFAKTLIPELFKHNNYASFVRQLVNHYLSLTRYALTVTEHVRLPQKGWIVRQLNES